MFCGYAERVKPSARVAVLVVLASALGLAIWSDFPLCPVAGTFGVPCPGCGLTRATLALLRGDVRAALHFHPLVWLLAPLFIGFVGVASLELLLGPARTKRAPLLRFSNRGLSLAATALLVLTLGVWLARFAGYLGGPAPVTSMSEWLTERAARIRR